MKRARKNTKIFFAFRLLGAFCPDQLYEEIEGDLIYKFNKDVKAIGEKRAKRRLMWNVVRFLRPGILLRNKFSKSFHSTHMLKNYVKIMLRSLAKRKIYSAINIFGLTVGITFAMLIGVFVWGELQVNKQLRDVDQLYILEQETKDSGGMGFFSPTPLAKFMVDQYPTLAVNYYRFYDRNIKISKGDKHFIIQSMMGDSTFLNLFGLPVMYGDAPSAFTKPYSVVITDHVAKQFFNRSDVIGEALLLSSGTADREYIITGVLENPERNSVSDLVGMNAQVFISLQNNDQFPVDLETWNDNQIITYMKLAADVNINVVEQEMSKVIQAHGSKNQKENVRLHLKGLNDYYQIGRASCRERVCSTV